jgi:putative Holliday junction resolvase
MIFKDLTKFYQYIQNNTYFNSMGIDYGLKKTGIAVSKNLGPALPTSIIITKSQEILLQKIQQLIKQYEIDFLVLGFPDSVYDNKIFTIFATNLSNACNIAIYLQDETYSSKLANQMLQEIGMRRKKRNQIDDKIAAKIILDNFLDQIQIYNTVKA